MTVMLKKYHVKLEAEERARLQAILSKGKASAHAQRHARILLLADTNDPEKGWNDARIAEALATCVQTVERLRKLFVDEGFDRAMAPKKPDRHYVRKLDGSAEAHLVDLACAPWPMNVSLKPSTSFLCRITSPPRLSLRSVCSLRSAPLD